MLALCYYYGKPIIFVPKYIVRLENAAGQNVSCFYRYAIRQFISNDREMLEDVFYNEHILEYSKQDYETKRIAFFGVGKRLQITRVFFICFYLNS